MPITSESPAHVQAKPTLQHAFERSALAGKSPIEVSIEKPVVRSDPEDEIVDVGALSEAKLREAQAKDRESKATKAPTEPDVKEESSKPVKPDAKPVVPDLPVKEDWRPKGEKAGQQWDELKAKHKTESDTLKADLDRAKAELAQAKSSGGAADDIKALKAQLKQYQEVIRDIAIERDPAFVQRFEPREKTAIEAAKLAAGDQGSKLETLLKSPPGPWRDEQIEAIKVDLSESSQRRVDSALRMLDQLDLERNADIATQRSTFTQKQAVTEQEQREQNEARAQAFKGAFDSTLKSWTDPDAGHPFLVERKGDEAFNKDVAASKALASSLHQSFLNGELEAADVAKMMLHVAVAERTLKTAQDAVKRAEKAERALERLRGAQPGDGRAGQPENEEPSEGPQPGSPGYMKWITSELKDRQERDRASRRGE